MIPSPNLDDRSWEEIVDEAKRLIPQYCPQWTNFNTSDPGIGTAWTDPAFDDSSWASGFFGPRDSTAPPPSSLLPLYTPTCLPFLQYVIPPFHASFN